MATATREGCRAAPAARCAMLDDLGKPRRAWRARRPRRHRFHHRHSNSSSHTRAPQKTVACYSATSALWGGRRTTPLSPPDCSMRSQGARLQPGPEVSDVPGLRVVAQWRFFIRDNLFLASQTKLRVRMFVQTILNASKGRERLFRRQTTHVQNTFSANGHVRPLPARQLQGRHRCKSQR